MTGSENIDKHQYGKEMNMKEETKPSLTETDQFLMYGDRVRFFWQDADYYYNTDLQINWEGELEGLYAGPSTSNPKLAVVTVVSQGQYRGKVLYPRIEDLKRIESVLPAPIRKILNQKPEPEVPEEPERKFDIESLKEMRDNIMDNFDFERVHRVMEALEWGWATGGNFDTVIPDTSDIRKTARKLMDEVIEKYAKTGKEWYCVSTGGFDVELLVNEDDGLPDLTLKFVVEEWNEGGEFWDEYEKSFEKRKLTK